MSSSSPGQIYVLVDESESMGWLWTKVPPTISGRLVDSNHISYPGMETSADFKKNGYGPDVWSKRMGAAWALNLIRTDIVYQCTNTGTPRDRIFTCMYGYRRCDMPNRAEDDNGVEFRNLLDNKTWPAAIGDLPKFATESLFAEGTTPTADAFESLEMILKALWAQGSEFYDSFSSYSDPPIIIHISDGMPEDAFPSPGTKGPPFVCPSRTLAVADRLKNLESPNGLTPLIYNIYLPGDVNLATGLSKKTRSVQDMNDCLQHGDEILFPPPTEQVSTPGTPLEFMMRLSSTMPLSHRRQGASIFPMLRDDKEHLGLIMNSQPISLVRLLQIGSVGIPPSSGG